MDDAKVPDEEPTHPELPYGRRKLIMCPKCSGERTVLHHTDDGTVHRARSVTCPFCDGSGRVDPAKVAALNDVRQGRPHE